MEETDGCAKQYRCASAINLLSMLPMKYNIVIDRAVGAPGHGKDVVDGLNALDERYLKQCMFRLLNPEQKRCENKMEYHSTTKSCPVSFAAECRRLLQNQADNIASMITSKGENKKKYDQIQI